MATVVGRFTSTRPKPWYIVKQTPEQREQRIMSAKSATSTFDMSFAIVRVMLLSRPRA